MVQEVDRARTAVQYVAAGFGISIFGEHICRQPAPGVKFIPLCPGSQKIRYGVAWRKSPPSLWCFDSLSTPRNSSGLLTAACRTKK